MILTIVAENVSYCGVPFMAIIAAAAAVYQMGKGIDQNAKAKKMERSLKRPVYNPKPYEIPKEVDQYLQKAKMEALDQKLPGQQVMEERISGATANAIAATQQSGTGSAEILNSIASVQRGEDRAVNDLNAMAAQDMIRKQQNVDAAISNSAEWNNRKQAIDMQQEDKKFQVNEYDPYKEKAAAISALKGAGSQNVYGGIQGISSVAMTQMQYGEKKPPAPVDNSWKGKTGQPYSGVPMQAAGQPQGAPVVPNYQDYYTQAIAASSMPSQSQYNGPYNPAYNQQQPYYSQPIDPSNKYITGRIY